MFFQSGDLSSGGRLVVRFSIALLLPAGLILYLLYASQTQEEATHDRNLRWLAQMATQISDRVQIYSNFVRDRAEHPAVSHPNSVDANVYSIEALKPTDDSVECDPARNLAVQGNGQERWLLFFQAKDRNHACAKSDLKELVEPTIRKDAFTSVVLAQRDGKVLYQSGPESLKITNVSFLFSGSGDGRPKPSPPKTATSSNDPQPRAGAPTSSIHLTSQIGDEKFEVFVQPLPLRVEDQPGNGDWILLGISEKHNLLDSSSPNGLMVVLPLVLLLVGMSWPLQRLWSMAPFESMRRGHVVAVALCSLGVVVVLSLLGVFEYSRQMSMTRADRQLTRFAEALGRNFTRELKLAVDQLYYLDHEIASQANPQSRTSILDTSLAANHVRLPFEYADWIDGKGNKTIRWTVRETPAQLVNVSDRSYFREAMTGKKDPGSTEPPNLPGFSRRFAIEQVLSRTSGRAMTMLGIPSQLKQRNPKIEVASLAVHLVSLSDPVVSRDLGFAIIEPNGRVLFHSEQSRAFVENLFDECLESGELRGIVSRRIQAFVDLDYAANPHRMFVTPIPGVERLPWTLVVFRKLAANRMGRIQALVDASALLFVYAAGLGLALAIALLLGGRKFRRRLSLGRPWTGLEPWRMYVVVAGGVLAIIVWRACARLHDADLLAASIACAFAFVLTTAFGMHYCVGESSLVLRGTRPHAIRRLLKAAAIPVVLAVTAWSLDDGFMTIAGPVAAVLGGLLVSRAFRRMPRTHNPALLKPAWLAWGVELVLVLGISPVVLLSKLSYEYEAGLRLRDSQFRLWNAEAERRKAVERAIEQTPGVSSHPEIRTQLLSAVGLSDVNGSRAPLYYYGSDTSRISLLPAMPAATGNLCAPGANNDSNSNLGPFSDVTWALLAALELPSEERLMGFDARRAGLKPAGNLWTWREHARSLWLCQDNTVLARARLPVFNPFRVVPDVVQASSTSGEGAQGSGEPESSTSTWLVLAAILAAVAGWMNTLRRRMLLIGAPGTECAADPPYDCDSPAPGRLFLLAYPEVGQKALPGNLASYARIDLSRDEVPLDALSATAEGLLLDRFEARFHDPKIRLARLELLESALLAEGKLLAIRSALDCVRYLAGGASGDSAAAADEGEINRWCMVLSHFERRTPPPSPAAPIDHAAIWDTCSEQERDVLLQICRHGLVNPRAFHIVCGLLRRGLIRRTPDHCLRFSCVEFRQFVANATLMVSEKSNPRSAGKRLPAYAIGLLLLGIVLLFSQEELTTRLIGFLTTVTGGFETVRKQLAGTMDLSGTKKG